MHIKAIKEPTATNKRGQTALNRYPESAPRWTNRLVVISIT